MFNMRPAGMTVSAWEAVWPVLAVYAGFSVAAIIWSIISVRRVYRKSIGSADGGPRRRKRHFRWRPGLGNRPMLWKELFAASAAFQLGWLGRIATALLFAGAIVPAMLVFYRVRAQPAVQFMTRPDEVVGLLQWHGHDDWLWSTVGCDDPRRQFDHGRKRTRQLDYPGQHAARAGGNRCGRRLRAASTPPAGLPCRSAYGGQSRRSSCPTSCS